MRSRFRWRLRLRDVTPLTTVVMATVAELKEVLKDTLEKRGVLGQLKARIRAEVFSALDDQHEPRPSLCHENLLLNELIREYLEFNQYKYTASVLHAESGQPEVPLDRQFLINELNIVEDPNRKAIFCIVTGKKKSAIRFRKHLQHRSPKHISAEKLRRMK